MAIAGAIARAVVAASVCAGAVLARRVGVIVRSALVAVLSSEAGRAVTLPVCVAGSVAAALARGRTIVAVGIVESVGRADLTGRAAIVALTLAGTRA